MLQFADDKISFVVVSVIVVLNITMLLPVASYYYDDDDGFAVASFQIFRQQKGTEFVLTIATESTPTKLAIIEHFDFD